ncbi:hypothetical protein ALC53_11977 [Atta colombica]|uniref:Uncharacterized protein n=1 Tax=Atta colombica TaxID=520822 RepID=A0A195B016_9HYME|nr:hypothetical protein ALC53_11977 [Atta colombica]
MRFRYGAGSTSGESSATRKRPRKQSARRDLGYFIPKRRPYGGDVSMPDGIMVASACLPACLPCGAIAGPETSNNSLSIAPHGGGESGVLMISFRRYGPCFCPAPLCRLPST